MAERAYELLALAARFWFLLLIFLLVYSAFRLTWRELRNQRRLRQELADAKRMGHLRYIGRNYKGVQRGREWIFQRESTVGSAGNCDIILAHPSVRRHHARLFAVEGYLSCEPAPDAVCFGNGEAFTERTTFVDGDELVIGDLPFRVELYDEPLGSAFDDREQEAESPRKMRRMQREGYYQARRAEEEAYAEDDEEEDDYDEEYDAPDEEYEPEYDEDEEYGEEEYDDEYEEEPEYAPPRRRPFNLGGDDE